MKIEQATTEQRTECCGQCPFARDTPKEYLDTRGDNSERFIGQAHINAVLPCHMESEDNNATVGEGRQCAGAAKFRANLHITGLHPSLGTLPPDRAAVFGTAAALLAHHRGISAIEAIRLLRERTPMQMGMKELMEGLMKGRVCNE